MLLLVGLGNPGPRHANHRHNIGFMAVDEIVRRHGFGPWRTRFRGRVAEGRIEGGKVLALEPETYMNESGRAVGEAVRFYKLDPETEVIVIYDEIDLKPGKVKVKLGGGAGGHNGIRSIDNHIGRDYRRVRLGVGHPGDKDLVHGYVLQDFAKAEVSGRDKLIDAVASELPRLIAGDGGGFMSRLANIMNPPKPKPPKPDSGPEAEARPKPVAKTGPSTEEDADGL
ncbi:MAG: aminoacyl-tRNA hydrolase [Alphaproteobacteria bacterium]